MDAVVWMIKGFLFLGLSIFLFQFDNGFSYALGTFSALLIFKYLGLNETDYWDAHEDTDGLEPYDLESEAKPFFFWLGFNFVFLLWLFL